MTYAGWCSSLADSRRYGGITLTCPFDKSCWLVLPDGCSFMDFSESIPTGQLVVWHVGFIFQEVINVLAISFAIAKSSHKTLLAE